MQRWPAGPWAEALSVNSFTLAATAPGVVCPRAFEASAKFNGNRIRLGLLGSREMGLASVSLMGMNGARAQANEAAGSIARRAIEPGPGSAPAPADAGRTGRWPEPSVQPTVASDMVALMASQAHFALNLSVFRTESRLRGLWLDVSA
jgi:hypothetical protein